MSLINPKDIIVNPIKSRDANRIVKALHYSGKVTQNSQLHFGCFVGDLCLGVMQFGPSMDNRRMAGTVSGTNTKEFLELNRMAFDDRLPRNSESRCLSVALRIIKKKYQFIKWIVTFADGCQCGDGTIYRASGFDLIGVKKNTTLLSKGGIVIADKTFNDKKGARGASGTSVAKKNGWVAITGFQLKYIKFLHPQERQNLTPKILPYSAIYEMDAGMYKGIKRTKHSIDATVSQMVEGGVIPTCALHLTPELASNAREA